MIFLVMLSQSHQTITYLINRKEVNKMANMVKDDTFNILREASVSIR